MIFLPSCGKKIKKENVTPSRPNCTVSASYNGIDCSARINYDETGRMTVEMLSPIKGMTLSVDDSGCRLGYDGMEIDYTAEQAKGFCPFIGLYSVLKTVCYTVPVIFSNIARRKRSARQYQIKMTEKFARLKRIR